MEVDPVMFIEFFKEVGFPIAAFMLMWYTQHTTLKELKRAIDALKEKLT